MFSPTLGHLDALYHSVQENIYFCSASSIYKRSVTSIPLSTNWNICIVWKLENHFTEPMELWESQRIEKHQTIVRQHAFSLCAEHMSNTSTVSSFCSLKLDSCCLLGLNTIWRATWPLFAAFFRYFSSLYSNSAVFNFEYDGSNGHFETDFLLHLGENRRKVLILFRAETDITRNHIAYCIQIRACAIVQNDYSHKTAADRQGAHCLLQKRPRWVWKLRKGTGWRA